MDDGGWGQSLPLWLPLCEGCGLHQNFPPTGPEPGLGCHVLLQRGQSSWEQQDGTWECVDFPPPDELPLHNVAIVGPPLPDRAKNP